MAKHTREFSCLIHQTRREEIMYDLQNYMQQETHGKLEEDTGIYITNDGKRWKSLGLLSFGNNNDYEVMVLEQKPCEFNQDFRHNQYPVYLASHDDGTERLGQALPEFMREMSEKEMCHHLPTIIRQVGEMLAKYEA